MLKTRNRVIQGIKWSFNLIVALWYMSDTCVTSFTANGPRKLMVKHRPQCSYVIFDQEQNYYNKLSNFTIKSARLEVGSLSQSVASSLAP